MVRQLRSRDRLGLGAVLGPALSTYTAVLIADFSIPVWHGARRELTLVFAVSSAASAGSAAAILTSTQEAGPARWLAVGGAIAEPVLAQVMKRRLGNLLAEPYGISAGRPRSACPLSAPDTYIIRAIFPFRGQQVPVGAASRTKMA